MEMETGSSERTMVTGGAEGADWEWATTALEAGVCVEIMSFSDHARAEVPNALTVILGDDVLVEAKDPLRQAARQLKRRVPDPHTRARAWRLLSRNWFIVHEAQSLYAVGYFETTRSTNRGSVGVQGGTGWACQMYFERMLAGSVRQATLFLFELARHRWYAASCDVMRGCLWMPKDRVPLPEGRFAAIGTRDLPPAGSEQIQALVRRL
jgi:hypothetical protein